MKDWIPQIVIGIIVTVVGGHGRHTLPGIHFGRGR